VYVDTLYFASSRSERMVIPGSASIHGLNGAFFHTDAWILNESTALSVPVSLRHYCLAGQTCRPGEKEVTIPPGRSVFYEDILGTLFQDPETAGAIEILYDPAIAKITAGSRTYTPSQPAPTFGTAIPALPLGDAKTRAVFYGLASNGADRSKGFRTNAGAYNPSVNAVTVTFALYDGFTGLRLGSIDREAVPFVPFQINDVFAAVGAGSAVTQNAYLVVTSRTGVFHNITVIDNQSGDSVFVPASSGLPPF
jgi:hypothetical protein